MLQKAAVHKPSWGGLQGVLGDKQLLREMPPARALTMALQPSFLHLLCSELGLALEE